VQHHARVRAPWRLWDEQALRRNIGVYLHVPFCLRRCRYCDFLSFATERPHGLSPEAFTHTLHEEIAARGAWMREHYGVQGRYVDSVFFGGGTPTFLAPEALAGLVQAVREHFPLARAGAEITIEANPDTLAPGYIAALARAGVNRLSLGIQATQERHLRFLGRTHRWCDILPRLREAAQGPVRRLSFDLIYAVPGLRLAELQDSIARLMALGPEHISAYELTIEPGTWLYRWAQHNPQRLPSVADVVAQQRLIERRLAGYGLYRYEVSNYARPGAESRHNLRYWRGGDYIGLGLGAASRLGTTVVNNSGVWEEYERGVKLAGGADDPLVLSAQSANVTGNDSAQPNRGFSAPHAGAQLAPPADTFLRLRTRLGLPLAEAVAGAQPLLSGWLARGWVRLIDGRLEVTSRGLNFADSMAREF
jgi:oxygen-independent coproporphyrinogen III oxidase